VNKNLGDIAAGPLCTYLTRDYIAGAGALPLASAVHVETVVGQDGSFPIDSVAESRFVAADCGAGLGARALRVVAFVNLAAPDAAAALDAHTAALGGRFAGVRMILNHTADGSRTWPQVPHARFATADAEDPAGKAFAEGFAMLAP